MNFKYLLLPVVTACLGSSLQAQTPDASASASSSPAFEEHQGGWHHHHGGWMFRKLNLTDAQRQQLKQMRASSQQDFRSARLDYLKAKVGLETAISQNDPAQISSAAGQVASAQTQLIQLRAKWEQQFVTVLSPSQLQTWEGIHQQKATRLQERINELHGQ
jgi:Spy/CpxP family protein refolding chaperone